MSEPNPDDVVVPDDASELDGFALGERDVEADAEAAEAGADDVLSAAEAKAAEHLADLQRLQAEYVNYRKRVDRDRELARELAVGSVIEALIPTLDDIAGARAHGELDGPFLAVAEKLEGTLGRLGWASYGAAGDAFDPALHEALTTVADPAAAGPTVREVAQPGHRLGERVLRPARVIVAQPE